MQENFLSFIKQKYDFPQKEFEVKNNKLFFNQIDLTKIIEKYQTPLRISFLPKIIEKIKDAFIFFEKAMKKNNYEGKYFYMYCTKSSSFSFILKKMLKSKIKNFGIETSSTFDIGIIKKLYETNFFQKHQHIICNGFKPKTYINAIIDLHQKGFHQLITILDNEEEIEAYNNFKFDKKLKIGIRISTKEFFYNSFTQSRFGIDEKKILSFYQKKIKENENIEFKLLHFFINTGIKDEKNYWHELEKLVNLYCLLKKHGAENLDSINIGGGFPAKFNLGFDYDYQFIVDKIIEKIKIICMKNKTKVPHIFTEFGTYTVGESGALITSVIGKKNEYKNENWYILDTSFFATISTVWSFNQKYIVLPINQWDKNYKEVNIGGLTCDSADFYNQYRHESILYLPKITEKETLYLGFFHTGAYEEMMSSYSGLQHCLIPSPKHLIIDKDENGELKYFLFKKTQKEEEMLNILGF